MTPQISGTEGVKGKGGGRFLIKQEIRRCVLVGFEKYQVKRCGCYYPNVISSRVEFTFWLICRSATKLEITLLLNDQTVGIRPLSNRFTSEKATAEQNF